MKKNGSKQLVVRLWITPIIIIMILAFFADIFELWFYNYLNKYPIINKPELVVSVVTSIIVIVFAYYILMVEVLRNKYSQANIYDYISKNYSTIIFSNILNLFFALILAFIDLNFLYSTIVLYIHFFINLICIVVLISRKIDKNKENMMWSGSIINSRMENIKKCIDNKNITINSQKINEDLSRLKNLYKESVYNKYIFLQDEIIEKSYEFFKHILENKAGIILNSGIENYELIRDSFNNYIYNIVLGSLNNSSFNNYSNLFSIILKMYKDCLKCDQEEVYNLLCEKISFAFKASGFNNEHNYLITLNKRFALYIIEKENDYKIEDEKRIKWLEYVIDNLNKLATLAYFKSDNAIMLDVIEIYFSIMLWITEQGENFLEVKKLVDNAKRMLIILNTTEKIQNNYIKVVFLKITDEMIKVNNVKILKEYVAFLENVLLNSNGLKSLDIFNIVAICIQQIEKDINDNEIREITYKVLRGLTTNSIGEDYEVLGITLPNYDIIIDENDTKFEEYISDFNDYSAKAIYKGSITTLLRLFDVIEKLGRKLEKNSKKKQECLIKIYRDSIVRSIANDDKESFNICFGSYMALISYYDKEDKISHGLFGDIINSIQAMAESNFGEQKSYYLVAIIDKLKKISKLNISTKKPDNCNRIVSGLLSIGVSAIEYDNKEAIKAVSNNIGWIGKEAIDRGQIPVLKFVLNTECSMINLYRKIKTKDDLVLIFLGTLFIVLGGYSRKEKNVMCEHEIIEAVKKIEDIEFLKYSKILRDNSIRDEKSYKGIQEEFLYNNEQANAIYKKIVENHLIK